MKRHLLITALALGIGAGHTFAQLRTVAQLDSAANHVTLSGDNKAPARKLVRRYAASQLQGISTTTGGAEAFYIYTPEGGTGFSIMSADPAMPYCIGHSDEGTFQPDALPEGLVDFMRACVRQASLVEGRDATNGVSRRAASGLRTAVPVVSPLLGSRKWGQGTPYNRLCPAEYTGCVATAMSQIMAKHRWPEVGHGTVSYVTETNKIPVNVTIEGTRYDWNSMKNNYTTTYTSQAANAVATLMYHVGAAVEMDYTDDGSGAYDFMVVKALYENFGYDDEMRLRYRPYYKDEDWDAMLQAELASGRPLYYSGSDPDDGGHAYVIDGVNSSGLYHVNWGWDGDCNGYYAITALAPTDSGWDFSYYNRALFGMKPEDGVVSQAPQFLTAYVQVTCSHIYGVCQRSQPVTFSPGYFLNVGCQDFNGQVALQLTDESGNSRIVGTPCEAYVPVTEWEIIPDLTLTLPDDVADGNYRLALVSRQNGGEQWSEMEYATQTSDNAWNITVSGDRCGIENAALMPTPAITMTYYDYSLSGGAEQKRDVPFSLTVTELENTSNKTFTGYFRVLIIDDNGNIVAETGTTLSEYEGLKPGYHYTNAQTFSNCTVPDDLAPGHYRVMLGAKANGSSEWTVAQCYGEMPGLDLWLSHTHRTVGTGEKPMNDYMLDVANNGVNEVAVGETYKVQLTFKNWGLSQNFDVAVSLVGAATTQNLQPFGVQLEAGSDDTPALYTVEYEAPINVEWGGRYTLKFTRSDGNGLLASVNLTVTGAPELSLMDVVAESSSLDIDSGDYNIGQRIRMYAYNVQHLCPITLYSRFMLLITDENDNVVSELKDPYTRGATFSGQDYYNSLYAYGYIPDDLPDGRYRLHPAVANRNEPYDTALVKPADEANPLYAELVLRRPFFSIATGQEPEMLYAADCHTYFEADTLYFPYEDYDGERMRSWSYPIKATNVYNRHHETFKGKMFMVLTDEQDSVVCITDETTQRTISPNSKYSYGTLQLSTQYPADLPNGHYRVYFAAYNEEYDEIALVKALHGKSYIDAIVSYDYITHGTGQAPVRSFRTRMLSQSDTIYDTRDYYARLSVTNYGKDDTFYSRLYYYVAKDEYAVLATFDPVIIAPGQTQVVQCHTRLTNLTAGEYFVYFEDINMADLIGDSVLVRHALVVEDAPVPDAIAAPNAASVHTSRYDLQGRRLAGLRPRLLYIEDGKVKIKRN